MEKQILIPIILVLGLLTCGIGVYLYIRCRTKPVEALQQVVIDEQINKPIVNSIDNSTNISYDNTIPVDDVKVVEENLDRIVQVGNLRMTGRDRLRLKDAAEKRGVTIDNLQQAYNNMMDNQISGLERLEQGCDRLIDGFKGLSNDLKEVANHQQSSIILKTGVFMLHNATTDIDPNIGETNSRG